MIINPMWFYWMGIFDKLQIACWTICVIAGCLGCLLLFFYFADCDEDSLKPAKRLLLITLCFGFIGVFVPSEKTMTKMLVASQVNETNVERAKEIVDYVIDKIEEAKNDD